MNGLQSLGKLLIVSGIFLVITGVSLTLWDRIPFLGKLPGDIVVNGKSFVFYFPIVTSIILSLILSLILYFFRK